MKFTGTVVVTDPCYVFSNYAGDKVKAWDLVECGDVMERIGIVHYIVEQTGYGDWDNEIVDSNDTSKSLGKFCADSGQVGVFYLEEILKANPNYPIEKETKRGLAVCIPDFDGDISIEWNEGNGLAKVVGCGNINFKSIFDEVYGVEDYGEEDS